MLCAPPSLAVAGFARARTTFRPRGHDLHPFVAGMVGERTIRHVADVQLAPGVRLDKKTTCVDTIPAGPVFVGGGAASSTT